jgi:hypothetical protein
VDLVLVHLMAVVAAVLIAITVMVKLAQNPEVGEVPGARSGAERVTGRVTMAGRVIVALAGRVLRVLTTNVSTVAVACRETAKTEAG